MKYEMPEFEVIYFEAEDVIRTSPGGPVNPLPIDESSTGSMFNLF